MSDRPHVEVFTDGACMKKSGPGGYAARLKYEEAEEELADGSISTVPRDDLRELIPNALFGGEEAGTLAADSSSSPLADDVEEDDEAGAEGDTSANTTDGAAVLAEASLEAQALDAMIDDPVRMYLREIGRVSLLTAKDERRLARAIESRKHIDHLEKELASPRGTPPKSRDTVLRLLTECSWLGFVVEAVAWKHELPSPMPLQ